jgi:hypothetical protein
MQHLKTVLTLARSAITQRNTSMAALARDLLGVQTEFQQLGQTTDDDAYTLFLDACRRCSPQGGWDELE